MAARLQHGRGIVLAAQVGQHLVAQPGLADAGIGQHGNHPQCRPLTAVGVGLQQAVPLGVAADHRAAHPLQAA